MLVVGSVCTTGHITRTTTTVVVVVRCANFTLSFTGWRVRRAEVGLTVLEVPNQQKHNRNDEDLLLLFAHYAVAAGAEVLPLYIFQTRTAVMTTAASMMF